MLNYHVMSHISHRSLVPESNRDNGKYKFLSIELIQCTMINFGISIPVNIVFKMLISNSDEQILLRAAAIYCLRHQVIQYIPEEPVV